MFKLLSREFKKITPNIARKMLEFNTLETQRNLKPKHINYLSEKMRNNEFRTGELAFATNGKGEKILVNGQHQLKACVATNEPFVAMVEEFEYRDPMELSLLYRQFDSHAMRTQPDMVKVEADSLGLDWPLTLANLLVGAIFLKFPMDRAIHRSYKIEQLKYHLDVGNFVVNELFERQPNKYLFLKRVAVIASVLKTWEKHQAMTKTFWFDVRDGENLKKKDPTYKLREFLLTHTTIKGRGSHHYRKADDKEIQVRCIHAWNAFRRGESTLMRFYPDKPIPKVI